MHINRSAIEISISFLQFISTLNIAFLGDLFHFTTIYEAKDWTFQKRKMTIHQKRKRKEVHILMLLQANKKPMILPKVRVF